MTMYDMTDVQFQTIYNILSFALACMMSSTLFFWGRVPAVHEKYKTALMITGMVTFIASYHYMRIFNSWTESYEYTLKGGPFLTGKPFNDAYRYMDWLLTVPLLLMEIVLVMNVPDHQIVDKCVKLGVSSGLMIIAGYPGELKTEQSELSGRWLYWCLAMVPFIYVVYTLLIGLRTATESETNETIKSKIKAAQWVTVISWLTYPFVYIIPMFGAQGANAVVGIQVGYCMSDIIAKCGVGMLIYQITIAKSQAVKTNPDNLIGNAHGVAGGLQA